VVRPLAVALEPTPRADSLEKPLWMGAGERRNDLKTLNYRRFPRHGRGDESSSRRRGAGIAQWAGGD
jgi:hypothetical protein